MLILEQERRLILEYGRQMRELYPDRDWGYIEPLLHQIWVGHIHRLTRWEDAKELMRQAWHVCAAGDASEVRVAAEGEERLSP